MSQTSTVNMDNLPLWVPDEAAVSQRLQEIMARGSLNLGAAAGTERLMLMVTRSCELRCGYCFVQKTEQGVNLPIALARRGIDLLMQSRRPKLELQLFGGEPTRCWDVVTESIRYAHNHRLRRGRALEIIVTTNGVHLDVSKIAFLSMYNVTVLFSLDGDQRAHRRFRQAHTLSEAAAYAGVQTALQHLRTGVVSWFANTTLSPQGADDCMERYLWARENGVSKLQLNYSVGHFWRPEQERRYLLGLQRVLWHHAVQPTGLVLFNWSSHCEPVMLSDDLIVETDGQVLHDGAIFLERSLPLLKETYSRGHLDTLTEFDPLRYSLQTLHDVMTSTYPANSKEHRTIVQNIRMGVAVDLVIGHVRAAVESAGLQPPSPH